MTEQNALTALQQKMGLRTANKADMTKLGLLGGGDYLAELKVVSSGKLVNKMKMPVGTFAIQKGDSATCLGEEIDFVILAWRPKAIDFNEGVSSYDAESPIFRDIFSRSSIQDSGCVAGPEFLVFLPSQDSFYAYHANSISASRIATILVDACEEGFAIHGNITMAENKKKKTTWQVPVWTRSEATLDAPSEELTTNAVESWEKSRKRAEGGTTGTPVTDETSSDREE